MKIYLYVKTHQITGLKYLGKTIQDPFTYKGSGKRWRRHLAKHGNLVATQILLETTNPDEIKKCGLYYSELWNIVNDDKFANLKPESGNGGDMSMCDSYIEGIKRRNTSGSKNSMYGRSAIVENNIRWYNNGIDNVYVSAGTEPSGYIAGRIITYKKPHTEQTKELIRLANKKPDRPCISPTGTLFPNVELAGKSVGISGSGIKESIKRGKSGWKYL